MQLDARSNFKNAINSWKTILGNSYVIVNREEIEPYEQTTFETEQIISAIIQPKNTDEVSTCIKIANNLKISVYPISRGRNWGLGSFVPPKSNCVILDLRRLDRIVDFNEELGYIKVEAGVTFTQVTDYLIKNNSTRYLSVIGGPSDASLIGNLVERGDGVGPYGNRLQHSCNYKIVLPDGKIINSGFGCYEKSKVANLHQNGVGSSFGNLFTQANFGVITQATFWLPKKPNNFQVIVFTLKSDEDLLRISESIRSLIDENIILPHSVAIWNRYKFLASEIQYPWHLENETPLSSMSINKMSGPFKDIEWIGMIGVYSPTNAHAKADRKLIKKRLNPYSKQVISITKNKAQLISILKKPLKYLTKKDIDSMVNTIFNKSIFIGSTTNKSVKGMYWRKRIPIPENPNPERDKCGIIWMCPTVPLTKRDINISLKLMRLYLKKFKFEPIIALTFPSSRTVYFLPTIVYDREQEGLDLQAKECHDEMLNAFIEHKYYPHRLGIQSMKFLPATIDDSSFFWNKIKDAIDPNRIIAPNRYEK